MPADHKVSVGWQIFFTFVTGLNFWAFYRIRKLRKYLLCVFLPSITASIVFTTFFYNIGLTSNVGTIDFVGSYLWAYVFLAIFGVGLQALAVYLVIRRSREHNRKYDRSTQP